MDVKAFPTERLACKTTQQSLFKRIKKHLYGKPQAVKIIFPAGFSEVAYNEIEGILNNPWLPQKVRGEITNTNNNEIFIYNIHLSSIIELLLRSIHLTDIRLILLQTKISNKFEFEKKCMAISWEYYLNKSMTLKIKVNSVASRAFHETALKGILHEIVDDYVNNIITGEKTTATTGLYAELYKDKLTLSISLAGELLYKRGYRGTLSASAPLREDIATCLIHNSLEFTKKNNANFNPNTIAIPFSGTGTFAFEYLQYYSHISSILFGRQFALQKMTFFREETFNFLIKKYKSLLKSGNQNLSQPTIICIDSSKKANLALQDNISSFNHFMKKNELQCIHPILQESDFLKMNLPSITDLKNVTGDVFIPLNPPYGIRLGKSADTINLYKNIAFKVCELAELAKKQNHHLSGFILCPNEETWSVFIKNLKKSMRSTYHFTQGGLDIRVCQFYI
jgi:23S rRNA G2445 N2-methylase RlmL